MAVLKLALGTARQAGQSFETLAIDFVDDGVRHYLRSHAYYVFILHHYLPSKNVASHETHGVPTVVVTLDVLEHRPILRGKDDVQYHPGRDRHYVVISAERGAMDGKRAELPGFDGTRAGGRFLALTLIGITVTTHNGRGLPLGTLVLANLYVGPQHCSEGIPDGQVPEVGMV